MGEEARTSIDEMLELACDLCIGIGAFVVASTGAVHAVVCDPMQPDDLLQRIELLALSCMVHPAAAGRQLFWNAEVSTEAESAEHLLACVVVPVWARDTCLGLLGVVDTWLPEPDDEQRAGLVAVSSELAVALSCPATDGQSTGRSIGHATGNSPPGTSRDGVAAHEGVEPFLTTVLDRLPEAVLVTRGDGTVVAANRALRQLAGVGPGELLAADDLAAVSAPASVNGHDRGRGEDDGGPAPTGELRHLLLGSPGGPQMAAEGRSVTISDLWAGECVLTVVRHAHGARPLLDVGLEAIVDGLDDGVVCLDPSGTVVMANRAAHELYGLPPHRTMRGDPLPELAAWRDDDGHAVAHDDHPCWRALREGVSSSALLVAGDDEESQRRLIVSARPFDMDGQRGALVVIHDATVAWEEQRRLLRHALRDPLTGLAKRSLLLEELRRMLRSLGRRGGSVALVRLDLHDLAGINEKHGQEVGNEVLTAVARRLKAAVRGEDVVARVGGDTFLIAHLGDQRAPDADVVAARVRKVLSAPLRLRLGVVEVSVSLGWISTEADDLSAEAFLAEVEHASYGHEHDRDPARRSGA